MTSSRLLRAWQASVLLAAIYFAVAASFPPSTVTIDFESPTYSNGTIVGSNGWNTGNYIFADPFFGGHHRGRSTSRRQVLSEACSPCDIRNERSRWRRHHWRKPTLLREMSLTLFRAWLGPI